MYIFKIAYRFFIALHIYYICLVKTYNILLAVLQCAQIPLSQRNAIGACREGERRHKLTKVLDGSRFAASQWLPALH